MISFLLWSAAVGAEPGRSVHPPAIEAHLAPIVGDWTRAGKESTYRDHCVWYGRRAFVVCTLTDASSGHRTEAIIGFSKDDARFTYQSFSNDGSSHIQYGYATGDSGLVFTDERKMDGKPVRLTTSIVPQRDGRLHMTQDRSTMGGAWHRAAEVHYVKRK